MGCRSSVPIPQGEDWPQFIDLDESATLKEPIKTHVTGNIPNWLTGSLYRNGSGIFKMGNDRFSNLFDGYSVLHRWSIHDGEVTYLSTALDSDLYKKAVKHNRLIGEAIGSNFPDPCKTIFNSFFSYFMPFLDYDNQYVSIFERGDKLYAMAENTIVHEINGSTLTSDRKRNIENVLNVHSGTSHPHVDKEGNMFYYGTNPNDLNRFFNFVKIPPAKKGEDPLLNSEIVASLPSRWKLNYGYAHSFGMTENYLVHFEQPVCLNLPRILCMRLLRNGFEKCLVNYPNEPIQIHVANKTTGERIPIKFLAPHGFIFHFINCYEESDFIVVDVVLYKDGTTIRDFYLETLINFQKDKLPLDCGFARFVLPLSIHKAKEGENLVTLPNSAATAILRPGSTDIVDVTKDTVFDPYVNFELPKINYDYNARKYRYFYGSTFISTQQPKVVKFDLLRRKVLEWHCEEDRMPGEPVFVKDPHNFAEDDGVILCPVLALTTAKPSYLVVLDARSFTELGRATVPPHVKMNITFHGGFYNRFS